MTRQCVGAMQSLIMAAAPATGCRQTRRSAVGQMLQLRRLDQKAHPSHTVPGVGVKPERELDAGR